MQYNSCKSYNWEKNLYNEFRSVLEKCFKTISLIFKLKLLSIFLTYLVNLPDFSVVSLHFVLIYFHPNFPEFPPEFSRIFPIFFFWGGLQCPPPPPPPRPRQVRPMLLVHTLWKINEIHLTLLRGHFRTFNCVIARKGRTFEIYNFLWTVIFGICPISRVPRHD